MDPADLLVRVARDGVLVKLRVVPGARRDAIVGTHGDALRVAVRAVAEKGRANAAVERLVAAALGVAADRVGLVGGHGSRDKLLLVRELGEAEVRARLAAAATR